MLSLFLPPELISHVRLRSVVRNIFIEVLYTSNNLPVNFQQQGEERQLNSQNTQSMLL